MVMVDDWGIKTKRIKVYIGLHLVYMGGRYAAWEVYVADELVCNWFTWVVGMVGWRRAMEPFMGGRGTELWCQADGGISL